jgi:hypothetical protein
MLGEVLPARGGAAMNSSGSLAEMGHGDVRPYYLSLFPPRRPLRLKRRTQNVREPVQHPEPRRPQPAEQLLSPETLPFSSSHYDELSSLPYLMWPEQCLSLQNSFGELDKNTAGVLRTSAASVFHTASHELLGSCRGAVGNESFGLR